MKRRLDGGRAALLLVSAVACAGCGGELFGFACTDEQRPNLIVEVREAASGRAAAIGTIGTAHHESGTATDLAAIDSLRLFGNWRSEQAGSYMVVLHRPGWRPETLSVRVDEDACHVKTRTVQMTVRPNPVATPQLPLHFAFGARVPMFDPSAGVQVRGDTLVVIGSARSPCSDLVAVAFRTGTELHVQLQPREWRFPDCVTWQTLQQFEVRYALPQGNTYVQLTSAVGFPTTLFSGAVNLNFEP